MFNNKDPRGSKPQELIQRLRKVNPVVFKFDSQTKQKKRPLLASGLTEYSGDWGNTQVAHLLKRTLFGVKQSEINSFGTMSMQDAVDQIVSPSSMSTFPLNNYSTGFDISDPDVPIGESWVEAPYNNDLEGYRIHSLKSWLIGNMLDQEATIHQKLTLFWHNLLVTQFWDLFISKASYKYYRMLYDNAFGNYKTLIKELTVDPAMLFFLNGTFNNKEAPDENYGRELQELFCIGKGTNAKFEETDVKAAARVLTGWAVDWQNTIQEKGIPKSLFVPDNHDTDDKQFSSFYGSKVISGKSGLAGAEETDELLDMIFDNQETAAYICRRLYNFFVYHSIDESTEANVIQPLAELFRSPENNYQIEPILKVLFKSEHFYDVANIGAAIKNPSDHILGLWRVMDMERPDDLFPELLTNISINWSLSELGMEIGDPPSVSGWQAYYQDPSYDKLWINTDTITKRALRQDSFIHWGHWVSENLQIKADIPKFISTLNNPGDPNLMIQELGLLLHGVVLSTEVIDGMKAILLSGQSTDAYWTTAWDLYINEPENEEYRTTVENRLKSMFSPLLQLSEFQLM